MDRQYRARARILSLLAEVIKGPNKRAAGASLGRGRIQDADDPFDRFAVEMEVLDEEAAAAVQKVGPAACW